MEAGAAHHARARCLVCYRDVRRAPLRRPWDERGEAGHVAGLPSTRNMEISTVEAFPHAHNMLGWRQGTSPLRCHRRTVTATQRGRPVAWVEKLLRNYT
jgi:hypothetical protein